MLLCRSLKSVFAVFDPMMFCVTQNQYNPGMRSLKLFVPNNKASPCSVSFPISYTQMKFFSSDRLDVIREQKALIPKTKKLCLDVSCNLNVKPADHQSIDVDSTSVRVLGSKASDYNVKFIESEDYFTILGKHLHNIRDMNAISLEIEIPMHHDVKVLCENNVFIGNLMSNCIWVQVKNGNINCKNLRSPSISLHCVKGNVHCEGLLLGNIDIRISECGNINGFNFQGGNLKVETKKGDICISSIYSDKSKFSTNYGNLVLKNLHQNSSVFIQKGSLNVSALDGSLNARVNEGNVKLHISRLNGDSYIETAKGNVILSVAKEDMCQLNLSGKCITVKDEMKATGEIKSSNNGEVFCSFSNSNPVQSTMEVVANNGEVHLEKESWISSLVFHNK